VGGVRLRVAQFLANLWQVPRTWRLWNQCRRHRPALLGHRRLYLRCSALPGRLRVERRANGDALSVMAGL